MTITDTPQRNVLGTRMLRTAPCIINAVVDALSGLGVRHVPMPASPLNVWNAIQAARTANPNQETTA